MLSKLFNKKTMIAYTVILCVCFVFSCVTLGFNIHFSNKFKAATATGTDAKTVITNVLTSLAASILKNSNDSSASEDNGYDKATQAILTKKNVTGGFTIAGFVLTAVFMAGAITSSEYDKYLQGDKYKAKLKRLEKAKKAQAKAK